MNRLQLMAVLRRQLCALHWGDERDHDRRASKIEAAKVHLDYHRERMMEERQDGTKRGTR